MARRREGDVVCDGGAGQAASAKARDGGATRERFTGSRALVPMERDNVMQALGATCLSPRDT